MRYKFRYYNATLKFLRAFIVPLQNLLLLRVCLLLVVRFVSLIGLGQYLNYDIVRTVLPKIVLIFSILWTVIYCIFRKGVFLYDDRLVIARYTITLRNWKNRITVKYDAIESVNVNYSDLRFTRYHGSLLVPFGDESYNVELTLKNGKKYFFSIEDQEEFCQNLNSLIENMKDKDI